MTLEIAAVGLIAVGALVLFVGEWIRVDLVALLVLLALAITGLVTPPEALAGFSNPAVITVWAMFIVSAGLSRTGIAHGIGNYIVRVSGHGEVRLIATIMLIAAAMSAFMNNIGVAALLLPVVIDVSRVTAIAPSRLLMPLAFGSLLGGLTTLVGTPPNLLVSNAMTAHGYDAFGLFDYSRVGLAIVMVSVVFFLLAGRRILPHRSPARELVHRPTADLQARYGMKEQTFVFRIPPDSVLDGTTIAESRLTSIAGLKVIAVMEHNDISVLPSRDCILRCGQELLVQGRLDRLQRLRNWNELIISREKPVLWELLSDEVKLYEVQLAEQSAFAGAAIEHSDFHDAFRGNVLGIRRNGHVHQKRIAELPLETGDRLLVQGNAETLSRLEKSPEFEQCMEVSGNDLVEKDNVGKYVFVIRVPSSSIFAGKPLQESGIGDLFDFRLLGRIRGGDLELFPDRDETVVAEDRWLIQGSLDHMNVLRGFQELSLDRESKPDLDVISGETITLAEVMLDPHNKLPGESIDGASLKEKHGLELMAVWRGGRAYHSDLDAMQLEIGDAFLVMGPRDRLALLENDDDFLVLTPVAHRDEDTSKAGIAVAVLALFVFSILSGWLPIEIAAVMAATLMLFTGCLSMEQAYRAIDWRAVFLIAGMLPLGTALQSSGGASLAAEQVLLLGGLGSPWLVIFAFYGMTAVATLFIPTAALVVVMAPVVLTASESMGIAPEAGMMAIAIAASASFASPVSHPANLLVMGPGGYRFADYLKVGIPLTLVVFLVTVLLLPFAWPLQAS